MGSYLEWLDSGFVQYGVSTHISCSKSAETATTLMSDSASHRDCSLLVLLEHLVPSVVDGVLVRMSTCLGIARCRLFDLRQSHLLSERLLQRGIYSRKLQWPKLEQLGLMVR